MRYRSHPILILFLVCMCAIIGGFAQTEEPNPRAGTSGAVGGRPQDAAGARNVYPATVQPDLTSRLAATPDQEIINVEIAVAGGYTADEMNRLLDSTCGTLADRRRMGVLLLKERAARTQKSLVEALSRLQAEGSVKNVRNHWLTNTISVELIASCVATIAALPDVVEVFQYPELIQMTPDLIEPVAKRAPDAAGVEANLSYIGADSAWRMGYTGAGRIVCDFDFTGVEGDHPALKANWKGRDGRPSAAWFGNFTEDGYPAARGYSDLDAHGTHVVGIMVGHDDSAGDTVGVAPGADWIGAYGPLWEWAADPDGDPNTTDDVPDVINISFMTGSDCWDKYWDEIDMTEALGIVNIVAAGNDGPEPYSVVGPANRAVDSLTNFAVGSVDHRNGLIYWSSGRGPSLCDSVSVKPNVSAPGAYIRSTAPGGEYAIHGGTSMAAPHVAGAVAILRQVAPNASVRQIKEALLAGCTPMGGEAPNNDYGWGLINIPASIEFLASQFQADIRVVSFTFDRITIKDTLRAELQLNNRGYPIDSVYVSFAGEQEGIRILNDTVSFGTMNTNQAIAGDKTILAVLPDTMYAGAHLSIEYTIHGAGGYRREGNFVLQPGIPGSPSYFTHTTGSVSFTVSNYGQYNDFRCGDLSQNWMYEGSLMIGIDAEHVSDDFRDLSSLPDNDFWYDIADTFRILGTNPAADQETVCRFDDGCAEQRIGVEVRQESFSWNTAPDTGYVILEYVLKNVSHDVLDGVYVGLALDWEFAHNNYDYDCEGDFSAAEGLGFIFKHTSDNDSAYFRGVAVLNSEGVASYRVINQLNSGYLQIPGLSDSAKFAALSGGLVDTNCRAELHETLMHVLSTGPFTLAPGASDTACFALLGSDKLLDLRVTASRARRKARLLMGTEQVLTQYTLDQNYPNPFNAATLISFTLPRASNVELTVFNVLGQRVRLLASGQYQAGVHEVEWDGTDGSGHPVSSGVYLYRLKAGKITNTKKMILLK